MRPTSFDISTPRLAEACDALPIVMIDGACGVGTTTSAARLAKSVVSLPNDWAELAGNSVDFCVIVEARFAVGGLDVTFGIDQHGAGTYTVVDDVLAMHYDTFESTIHDGHGARDRRPEPTPRHVRRRGRRHRRQR